MATDPEGERQGRKIAAVFRVVLGSALILAQVALCISGASRDNLWAFLGASLLFLPGIGGLSLVLFGIEGLDRDTDQRPAATTRIFPASVAGLAITARDELQAIGEQFSNDVYTSSAFEVIKPKVFAALKEGPRAGETVPPDMSARTLCWLILFNGTNRELISGMHHVYGGILGMRGQGLLLIWKAASKELEKAGILTAAQSAEELARLENEIREVG